MDFGRDARAEDRGRYETKSLQEPNQNNSHVGSSRVQNIVVHSRVITTFPRACPSSRYRIPSAISLSL